MAKYMCDVSMPQYPQHVGDASWLKLMGRISAVNGDCKGAVLGWMTTMMLVMMMHGEEDEDVENTVSKHSDLLQLSADETSVVATSLYRKFMNS